LNSSIISALDLFNSMNLSSVLVEKICEADQLPVNSTAAFQDTSNGLCHSSANSGRLRTVPSVVKYNESVKAPSKYLALNPNAKFVPHCA
jgi:hypothetical protein